MVPSCRSLAGHDRCPLLACQIGLHSQQPDEDGKYTMRPIARLSDFRENAMRSSVACAAAVSASVLSLVIGSERLLTAQIANNPYKVNYNWDKLEGRKIGVASGIRLDPDGTH